MAQKYPSKKFMDALFEAKEKQRIVYADRTFAEKIEVLKQLRAATALWREARVISKAP
jgi:hypothetical protein